MRTSCNSRRQAVTPCQSAFCSHRKIFSAETSYVPGSNPRLHCKASKHLPSKKAFGGISSHSSPPKTQSLPRRAEREAWPHLCLCPGIVGLREALGRGGHSAGRRMTGLEALACSCWPGRSRRGRGPALGPALRSRF